MKEETKIALLESRPYMIVLAVIGLVVYLNALIVQDNITLLVAEVIGYVIVVIIIAFEIFSLILLKVSEVEIATKDAKIEELEAELKRQKGLR